MSSPAIDDALLKSFHMFWGNFPSPVMLVHKNRTIVATNRVGQTVGVPVGTRCADLGEKKNHAGCRANQALSEGSGVHEVGYHAHLDQVLDSYWVPLAGAEDYYVHFGIDITPYAAERFRPQACTEECSDCSSCTAG
jgi:hypothetical protein